MTLFCNGWVYDNPNNGYRLYITTDGKLAFDHLDIARNSMSMVSSSPLIENQWQHVAISNTAYNDPIAGGSYNYGVARLFVDGVKVAQKIGTNNVYVGIRPEYTQGCYIGRTSNTVTDFYNRLYSKCAFYYQPCSLYF